jgi:type I restriction enzyme S subunit
MKEAVQDPNIDSNVIARLQRFDRSKWKRVRFGDVVRCVDKTCRNPEAEGLTRVVGLEHLDPGELKITRWADVADGTSFTRSFRAGQVLFGKRRAYQRKSAVADFDGICSGDILVFEADSSRFSPALLPFVVASSSFIDHAIGTSAGSLSPRTKWKELAEYEFLLPDPESQGRLVDCLSEIEKCKNSWKSVQAALQLWLDATAESLLAVCPKRPLGEVLSVCEYGTSTPPLQQGAMPILRMMNLIDGIVDFSELRFVNLPEKESEKYRVRKGDILLNRTNSIDLVGKVGYFDSDEPCVFASYLLRLRAKPDAVDAAVLGFILASKPMQAKINALATPGASQANINAKNLQKLRVPIPEDSQTESLKREIEQIRESVALVRHHQAHLPPLAQSVIRVLEVET